MEGCLTNDLKHLTLVVTLAQRPELFKKLHSEQVLLGQDLEDLVGSLHELQVSPLGVPEDTKDTVITHPVDQRLEREGLAGPISCLSGANDCVQFFDTEDAAFKQLRGEALLADFEFELLLLLLGLVTVEDARSDTVDRDLDLADVVCGHVL